MSLKGKTNIFDGVWNRVEIDPATIRLLEDRVLIRDCPEPEKQGSIVIPEVCRDKDILRTGIVLAVGPGNRFVELGVTDEGEVRRRKLTKPCPECGGRGEMFDIRGYKRVSCPVCLGEKAVQAVEEPQVKPGDRVLYSRRREAEFIVNGERLSLMYAEQSVLAVLEA
jgi:co-chaperonin GroES (HSP10)